MKKLHYLSALLLATAGVTSSYAQTWVVDESQEYLQTIPVGEPVALRTVSGSNNYMCGTKGSSELTDDCAYVFEDAGNGTYRLKQYSTNLYLGDQVLGPGLDSMDEPPSQGDGSMTWYTSDPSQAFTFVPRHPVEGASGTQGSSSLDELGVMTSVSFTDANNFFIFTRSTFNSGNYATFLGYAGAPFLSPWVDTNLWYVSKLREAPAYSQLRSLLSSLFPNGITEASYPVGTNPGEISQDLYDEALQLYTEANTYNNTTDETLVRSMIEQLTDLSARLAEGTNPVTAGYYYIQEYRHENNGAVYANTNAQGVTGLNTIAGYDFPATPDVDDAAYIWQLEPTEDGFTIRNYATNQYIVDVVGQSTRIQLGDAPTTHAITHPTTNGSGHNNVFFITATSHADNFADGYWHADGNGLVVYWWDTSNAYCCFSLKRIDESALEGLAGIVEQNQRNETLSTLYAQACQLYQAGRRYDSDASADSDYTAPGLADDVSLLSTNAQETTEGAIANVVDGELNTYFHTAWSDGASIEGQNNPHYIQANGLNGQTAVTIKMTKRWDNVKNAPTTVRIDASTDGTNFTTVPGYSSVAVTYPYSATANETTKENYTALINVDGLPEGTQAIRMVVLNTQNGAANSQGNKFFSLSEFRVYAATYAADRSPYELVPADLRTNFENQMATAATELGNEAATEATIEALQAAYDEVAANLPEPSLASEAVEEARTYLETAEEGEGIGYFRSGGKDAFQAAIDAQAALIKDAMTLEEVNSVISAIDAATAEFDKYLILPEQGKVYTVRAATSNATMAEQYLYGVNANTAAKWGGHSSDGTGTEVDPNHNYAYLWVVEGVNGTQVQLRNLGTGLYVGNQSTRNSAVPLTIEPSTVTLRYARTPGVLNAIVGDGMYLNSQEGSGNWVAWDSANGTDNSALKIEEFNTSSFDGMTAFTLPDGNYKQFMCLPYDLYPVADAGTLYEVAGSANGNIYFRDLSDEDVLAAGTPFLYVPNAEHSGNTENFYVNDIINGGTVPTYVTEGGNKNGLYGTIGGMTVGPDCGTYHTGAFIVTNSTSAAYVLKMAPYQAYLGAGIPTIDANEVTDDMFVIEGVADQVTAIGNVTLDKNEKVDVYSTSGVLVRKNVQYGTATNGLPAGVYIVGGQKVLVK